MTEKETLEKVKKAIGVGGTYQDDTIQIYIDEVKEYLYCAGIEDEIINGKKSLGVIVRGVLDLWNYGASGGNLSTYFIQRVTQLSLCHNDNTSTDTDSSRENITLLSIDGLQYLTKENELFLVKEA